MQNKKIIRLAIAAMLTALSVVSLYAIRLPLIPSAPFLEYDAADIPVLIGSMLLGRRSRIAAVAAGTALLAGGLYERLGLLHAGIESTKDPKYVVEPQRTRIAEHVKPG